MKLVDHPAVLRFRNNGVDKEIQASPEQLDGQDAS